MCISSHWEAGYKDLETVVCVCACSWEQPTVPARVEEFNPEADPVE